MRATTLIVLAHLVVLSGCAGRERIYSNVYEGLKAREVLVDPAMERDPDGRTVTFHEYQTERRRALEDPERTPAP